MPGFRMGAGRLCLDFVRTLRWRGQPAETEELVDAEALAAWCRQLVPGLPEVAPVAGEVRDAQRLRESVREVLEAAMGPGLSDCRPSARARVNRAASGCPPLPRLTAAGQLRWYAADPLAAVLALVARDALELVTSEAVVRVRQCSGETCGALFLDASRPGSRRWCSMNGCGNAAKKATWRGRSAIATS